jgi:hypothetical protein
LIYFSKNLQPIPRPDLVVEESGSIIKDMGWGSPRSSNAFLIATLTARGIPAFFGPPPVFWLARLAALLVLADELRTIVYIV